jgi:prolyl-tRNA editing enzyme YbaK/EbsC (Cys-tRNA(Pro) deacylase)
MTPAIEAARAAGIAFTIHEYEGVDPGESDYLVSAGRRGLQLELDPRELVRLTDARVAALSR